MQRSLLNPKRVEGLFSEHYLRDRFPETGRYNELKPPNEVRKKVAALTSEVVKTATTKNEAQLEEDFIQPLLNVLGINYIVQVNTPAGTADYAFFASEEDRAAADARADKKYEGAVAVADAKRWGRPLDKGGGTAADRNANLVPTKQIANYIYETGVDWGVLTDGRLWRLYNRNTTPVSQSFFEINLIDAVEDADAFHLFYALFSGAAFAAQAQEYVLKESEAYWAEIGDDLKERAYEALAHLCNGFRKARPDLDVKDIYEAAVILLYRLLFVLYGESKKLLPVGEGGYQRYSLSKILNEVARGDVETFSESLDTFYGRLRNLFHLIAEGDESLNVYQYNGGLFKEQGLPFLPPNFLADNAVPDRYLAKALKLIAYTEDKKGRGRHLVDYGELDVRHLGSIYEGLLEFHPKLVDDEIVLETDKGERKATGSYFTPGYIVNYIVENTLGPLTEEMKTPEEVLTLKILDPAMGSGHFLVGAVDFIGRRCVARAGAAAEKTEKDYQRDAVERCIYGVDLNPLAVELAKLSLWLHTVAKEKPLSFLDHHLKLGNSLVGARVADLGELPKKGKKKKAAATQNLFATRLEQAMPPALNEVMGILGRGTEDIEDIEVKEELLHAAQERLKPFKAVADTWVSTYFGNDVTADEYAAALASISRPSALLSLPKVAAATAMSHGDEHRVGREFFHWQLEFPEVFFDSFGREKENPGFDAVIGNPPYVRADKGPEHLKLRNALVNIPFFETLSSKWDLYIPFIELGCKLVKPSGYFSMIISDGYATASYSDSQIEWLKNNRKLLQVDMFRGFEVFPGIGINNLILLVCNEEPNTYTTTINKHEGGFGIVKTSVYLEFNVLGKEIFNYDYAVGWFDKIEAGNYFRLDTPYYTSVGMVLNSHEKIAKGEFVKADLISEIKDSIHGKTYVEAKDLNKYEIERIRYLEWGTERCPAKIRRPTFPELYEAKKIMLGEPGKAIFDNRGIYCNHSVLLFVPIELLADVNNRSLKNEINKNSIDLKKRLKLAKSYNPLYVLSIINSKIFKDFLNRKFGGYYPDQVKKFPVRKVHFLTPVSAREEAIISLKNLYCNQKYLDIKNIICRLLSNAKTADFVAFHEKSGTYTEKSDVVHDFLAFLAQEMLDMNAEKQRLSREFLGWLDGETQGKLDDFRPKKYQKFWGYTFDDFYKWLRKNHESFGAAARAKLEEEFEKYKSQVLALTDKIERTDCLIDEVVYILYGLSEEEKNIVDPGRPERLKECGFE